MPLIKKIKINNVEYEIDLTDVYTKTETDNAISTAISQITDGEEISY